MFAMTRIAQARKSSGPVGQVVLSAGTTSWTVPAGVTSICVVCVQAGGFGSTAGGVTTLTVSGTVVCRAQNGNRVGDGGGNGGGGSPGSYDEEGTLLSSGAAGGAGGYSGNGGAGRASGGAGGGAGGGGGGAAAQGIGGGGVGLHGQGANGVLGSRPASNGSPSASICGGGGTSNGADAKGGDGGALAWKNNIAVTPGQVLTTAIGAAGFAPADAQAGGMRIIWGPGRAFPSTNTGDL